MAIGVPKVPYYIPGEIQAQWVDIYSRLSRERVVFLAQSLEEEVTNQLVGLLLYLSSEDEKKDIFVYVHSPGGSVSCRLAIVDTIQYIQTDVSTINIGTAASVASCVVACGRHGKRLALSRARFIIRQPEGGSKGQATEVFVEAEEVTRLHRTLRALYEKSTGRSMSQIVLDLGRDEFMSAHQAHDYGLIDFIRNKMKLEICSDFIKK
jgi:ATP-dependent Clp protease protease subunit